MGRSEDAHSCVVAWGGGIREQRPTPAGGSLIWSSSRADRAWLERAGRCQAAHGGLAHTITAGQIGLTASSLRIALASSGRSVRAPEAFPLKMLPQPAACSSAIWPARSWSRVETRAYPKIAISPSAFE